MYKTTHTAIGKWLIHNLQSIASAFIYYPWSDWNRKTPECTVQGLTSVGPGCAPQS